MHLGDHKTIGLGHALGVDIGAADHRNGIDAAPQRIR